LIFAQPDGSPFRPNSVSSAISALCRRLKMPKGVSLHTLRHSYASHRIASGDSIPEVSRDLGHSNPATTMGIYAHAIPGSRKPTGWTDYQKRHGGIGAEEEKPQ
jgi:integrase